MTITATWILIGGNAVGAPITGLTPLANDSRVEVSIVSNGTIIREKKKKEEHHDRREGCVPTTRIMVPFHAVFAPPALSSGAVSYPYNTPLAEVGRIRDEYFPASRILVTVNNVNGKGCTDYYIGELVGGHGAGDHAYVDIAFECNNKHCKVIEECHPRIHLGNSKKACVGSKVVLLGNFSSSQANSRLATSDVSMITGIVADNEYMDPTGTFLYQALVVNTGVYANRSGLPILDRDARLIGMVTLNVAGVDRGLINSYLGNGLVGGPSIDSMRAAFHTIMEGARVHEPNNQLLSICSSTGQFWIFSPGALLVGARPAVAEDFTVTRDFTSGSPVAGQPRIQLDDDGQFVSNLHCNNIGGYLVLGLAGANPDDAPGVANGHYYVPGGDAASPLPISLPVSPLLEKIKPGYIITNIDGYPVGALPHQNIPTAILWKRTFTKSSVKVTWLIGGNVLNTGNNNEEFENYTRDCQSLRFCVARLPAVLDFPYASVTQFPNVTGATYPSVTIPATQIQYPLLPARSALGSGVFTPAF